MSPARQFAYRHLATAAHEGSIPKLASRTGSRISEIRKLGYDLEHVIVIDDTAQKYERSYGNLVQVREFEGEPADDELLVLSRYLEALVEVFPKSLSKGQVAGRAGYEAEGGGFNNALGKLRSLELIVGRRGGEMSASPDLFDA